MQRRRPRYGRRAASALRNAPGPAWGGGGGSPRRRSDRRDPPAASLSNCSPALETEGNPCRRAARDARQRPTSSQRPPGGGRRRDPIATEPCLTLDWWTSRREARRRRSSWAGAAAGYALGLGRGAQHWRYRAPLSRGWCAGEEYRGGRRRVGSANLPPVLRRHRVSAAGADTKGTFGETLRQLHNARPAVSSSTLVGIALILNRLPGTPVDASDHGRYNATTVGALNGPS